jgi:pimeloyl-ACP methyl ester carboxylesterase
MMQFRYLSASLALVALGLFAPAFAAGDGANPAVNIRVLTLPADPPGAMRLAPGGGRELTPAVLFTPASGENPYAPAIVMMTEGPGSNPVRRDQPSRFVAERLAARGYTVLSVYSHYERSYSLYALEESRYDIKAALDFLEHSGHEQLVLAGHSYGAIAVANYLATMDDMSAGVVGVKRIKAAILFSPLTELRAYPRAELDQRYEQKVAAARASVASGKGLAPRQVQPGNVGSPDDDPWMATGIFALPAELFLNFFGPEAQTRNLALLDKINVPTLAISGTAEATVSQAFIDRWRTAAPGREAIGYATGDGHYSGLHDRISADVLAWLERRDLAARPNVTVTLASVESSGGRILDGVLYAPATGVDRGKPAFIMHHGLSEDVVHSSTHWLGWRLAQAGYTALSVSTAATSTPGATVTGTIDEVATDLGHWADWLQQQGYPRLVLQGHSLGGILISNYVSRTQDKRVVGLVYMAPTANQDAASAAQRLGEATYQRLLAEANDAVRRGEGRSHVMSTIRLQTAAKWLDLAGPESRGNHVRRISEVPQPILVLAGTADPIMRPEFVNAFVAAHPGKTDLVWYPGGTHGMKELKDRVSADIVSWTRRTFGP